MDGSADVIGQNDEAMGALDRLLAVAASETGQARCVGNFLLAWHNARACGGFDLTELWAVSDPVRADMLQVIGLIARDRQHAAAYGHEDAFAALLRRWRPNVTESER